MGQEKKRRNAETDALIRAVLSLQNEEEAYSFLEDLCTIHELQLMAQRLAVAKLLRQGLPFHRIAQETGASTTTISRVNRSLQYGLDGYRLVLEKQEWEEGISS